MGVRHAEANVRPARENFIESVAYIREVYRQRPEPPEWMSLLDECVSLKEF